MTENTIQSKQMETSDKFTAIVKFEGMIENLASGFTKVSHKLAKMLAFNHAASKNVVFRGFINNFLATASIELNPEYLANHMEDAIHNLKEVEEFLDMMFRPVQTIINDDIKIRIGTFLKNNKENKKQE